MQPQRIETTKPKTASRPSPQALAAVAHQLGRPLIVGSGMMALSACLPATPEMLARLEAGWSFDPS